MPGALLDEAIVATLSTWAEERGDKILRMWVFGSRVSGRSYKNGNPPTPSSDIDVATEIDRSAFHQDQDFAHMWMKSAQDDGWEEQLKVLCLPYGLDLHPYEGNSVGRYVERTGVLIFSRASDF